MIRIAVIGANGQAGRHIVAEALARGFEVTAFVRGSSAPATQHVVHKDVLAIEQSPAKNLQPMRKAKAL